MQCYKKYTVPTNLWEQPIGKQVPTNLGEQSIEEVPAWKILSGVGGCGPTYSARGAGQE